jgi:superfamily II DNA or RNA helicase
MVKITELNSVYLKIDCEKSIAKELSSYFTFRVPNFQYTPAYKNRIWDGKIRLFNLINGYLYRGLLDHLFLFLKERNYPLEYYPRYSTEIPNKKIISDFIESLILFSNKKQIFLHPHQTDAIVESIEKKRLLLVSPTGSGKSLIIYCLLLYYLQTIPTDKNILIIVPTTGLVAQMLHDFKDYSNGKIESDCHVIYSGQSKSTNKRIVISTWQSIYKEPKEFFDHFQVVIGDECHLFKAKSLSTIMTKLENCPYRIGTTGTLDGTDIHKLVIEGLFGKVFSVTSTKDLIDKNLLSKLEIECLILQYPIKEIKSIKKAKYQEEIDWLVSSKLRNDFIQKLASTVKGNTLVLFNYVEKHGIPLFENLKLNCEKQVFIICGKTPAEEREQIRQLINKNENCLLIASYGTCSTGINIKNIKNIIFTSPSKSVIRVLQSIGRGLRKAIDKTKVTVYDIGDDLHWKRYRNHALRHLDERILIYNREKFIHNRRFIRLGGIQ